MGRRQQHAGAGAGCGRRLRAQHGNQCAACGFGYRGAADRGVGAGHRPRWATLHVVPGRPRPALASARSTPVAARSAQCGSRAAITACSSRHVGCARRDLVCPRVAATDHSVAASLGCQTNRSAPCWSPSYSTPTFGLAPSPCRWTRLESRRVSAESAFGAAGSPASMSNRRNERLLRRLRRRRPSGRVRRRTLRDPAGAAGSGRPAAGRRSWRRPSPRASASRWTTAASRAEVRAEVERGPGGDVDRHAADMDDLVVGRIARCGR